MIVVHMESGLGNQMLDYADYLFYKSRFPNRDVYIETIVYDIKQDAIKMWNGYELNRIFGIEPLNIKSTFSDDQWSNIITSIQSSGFWKNGNWYFGKVFVDALSSEGLVLRNCCIDRHWNGDGKVENKKTIPDRILSINSIHKLILQFHVLRTKDYYELITDDNILCGHSLAFMHKNNGMREIYPLIKESFSFPSFEDEKNRIIGEEMLKLNSVSIHIRLGDLSKKNMKLISNGYYRKAVNYIKRRIDSPVFYIFSTPGDCEWCKSNMHSIGLDANKDSVSFVNWNSGSNSFRDMHLMSMCKHNIISETSFGWWGSFLNSNPMKITISSNPLIDTTVNL